MSPYLLALLTRRPDVRAATFWIDWYRLFMAMAAWEFTLRHRDETFRLDTIEFHVAAHL